MKPAGYHAWVDAGRLAVYVLGKPATLQIVDVKSGASQVVARDIGRALLRRPTGTISFVHREGEAWIVKEWDPATGQIRPLVAALEGSAERDAAWAPDGTLFMTRGRGSARLAPRAGGLDAGRRARGSARCRGWRSRPTAAGWRWWRPKPGRT